MLVQAAFIAASFANLCAKLANVFGIRAVARHCLKCESAHLRAFPVKPDAFGHHPCVFFHQTFVKAVIAGFKAFPAGFDAFLIDRFHDIHSFFCVFPSLYPALKAGKHTKNCCTSCTAVRRLFGEALMDPVKVFFHHLIIGISRFTGLSDRIGEDFCFNRHARFR